MKDIKNQKIKKTDLIFHTKEQTLNILKPTHEYTKLKKERENPERVLLWNAHATEKWSSMKSTYSKLSTY